MNRFKKKKRLSRDEFIEGANRDAPQKKAKKRVSPHVLLCATGKLETREDCSRILLYLRPDLEEDMEKFCSGSKQAILTYLLRRGLDDLIKERTLVIYENS